MSEPGKLGLAASIRLALRNLDRNRRRTGLTLASLVVGIAALTFLSALNDGWLQEMKSNFILTMNGHVQVHAKGFQNSRNIRDIMAEPGEVVKVVEKLPQVAAWSLRLRTSGMAATTHSTAGIELMAVDPLGEAKVTRLADCLGSGQWLTPETPRAVLLGSTLAENLRAAIGEKVVLTAQRPSGDMASEVFYLRGTLCGGAPQVDRTLAIIPLQTAQRWLGTGVGVSDVVVRATEHDAAETVREGILAGLPPERFEVMRWEDLDPVVRQWLRFSTAYSLVVMLVVMALVVAEVLNTMLMALHERTRELGVMEALGTSEQQLFRMMLIESVILVMAGSLVGFGAGIVAVTVFQGTGVDLSRFANAFQFFHMSPIIHPVLTQGTSLQILGTTLVAAVAAGLYPAWQATKIDPVTALRRL